MVAASKDGSEPSPLQEDEERVKHADVLRSKDHGEVLHRRLDLDWRGLTSNNADTQLPEGGARVLHREKAAGPGAVRLSTVAPPLFLYVDELPMPWVAI